MLSFCSIAKDISKSKENETKSIIIRIGIVVMNIHRYSDRISFLYCFPRRKTVNNSPVFYVGSFILYFTTPDLDKTYVKFGKNNTK